MSSGFAFAGEVYWGTNGAIEVCLDTMIAVAAATHASEPREPVVTFLRGWREAFFMGAVVELDDIVRIPAHRARLAELLTGAVARLETEEGGLTESGRRWTDAVLKDLLRALLSRAPTGA